MKKDTVNFIFNMAFYGFGAIMVFLVRGHTPINLFEQALLALLFVEATLMLVLTLKGIYIFGDVI